MGSVGMGRFGIRPIGLVCMISKSPPVAEAAASPAQCRSSNGEVRRRVANGEFAIGLADKDDYNVARQEGKPVGLVYYALSTPRETLVRDVNVSQRPREGVQLYAAWCGLNLIREHLGAH